MVGGETDSAREVIRNLDHEQAPRVGAGVVQFFHGRTGVQGQAAVPGAVGRRGRCDDNTRVHCFDERDPATEVGRREADVGAAVAQDALERTEERVR